MCPILSPAPLHFRHPEPPRSALPIIPVFLPFAGCPSRCRYCSQELQTGRKAAPIAAILDHAAGVLAAYTAKHSSPFEIAFYGGTFTAMPEADQKACLDFASLWRGRGAERARCSTRPDAVSPRALSRLASAGCTLVELGVQSFSTPALTAATRGYTGERALAACALVREAGLNLGIQLMPGMPGLGEETALADARLAAGFSPDCARLYPCLVLEGSPLAGDWRAGLFTPWSTAAALAVLARSCLIFWEARVPVIRMGLAPEPGLVEQILAGPAHPALGSRARGLALALFIEERLDAWNPERRPVRLHVPARHQGEFWGHARELVPRYAALGIAPERVVWEKAEAFRAEYAEE